MYSEEDLDGAVEAGVLSEESVAALRQHVARTRRTATADEEYVRLVTGFNDIFVVIACTLLLVSATWLAGEVRAEFGASVLALLAWGLAEFFTRKRRMALPSIGLLLAFVGGVFAAVYHLLDMVAVAGGFAALAAYVHWRRFKVPITVAAGAAAVITIPVALLISQGRQVQQYESWIHAICFIAGICVFLLAMRWDASDRARLSRRSDVAFWLHLLAAPLLVHPVTYALGVFQRGTGGGAALILIAFYLLITFVSLAIDRRALMVSALAYVLYALATLLKRFGMLDTGFATTALLIGSALLILSAFWHSGRAVALRFVPASLRERFPPLQ